MFALFCIPWAANAQEELTVYDGTNTNSYVPAYMGYFDDFSRSQFVIPADSLEEMNGGTISSIKFYTTAQNVPYTSVSTVDVYLMEVDYTTISAFEPKTDDAIVYQGTLNIVTEGDGGSLTIEFSTPYTYNGGNLLVAIENTTDAGYKFIYFYGQNVTGASGAGSNSSSLSGVTFTQRNFIPKTTFTYTPGGGDLCLRPTLAVSEITHNEATLTVGGGSGIYNVQYKLASATTWTNVASNSTNTTFTLSGLTPLTAYDVQAQSVCEGGATSDWRPANFNTTAQAELVGDAWSDDFEGATCGWELINGTLTNAWAWGTAVNNGGTHALYVSNDSGTNNAYTNNSAAMVYATKLLNFTVGKFEFAYNWMANGEANWDFLRVALVPASVSLTAGTSLPTGLTYSAVPSGWIAIDGGSQLKGVTDWQNQSVAVNVPAGNYYMVLAWRNDGSGGVQPPAAVDNVSITRVACAYDVEGLAIDNVTTNSATLTWTAGEAEQWQVAFADNGNFDNATEAIVSAATYNMTGLQPSTRYYARVRAYCGGEDFGSWSSVFDFFTDCAIIPALGYTENFDSYTSTAGVLPICWNKINTTSYSSYQGYPRIYNYGSQSSPNCLYFSSYYASYSDYDPQDQYAILPEMENLAGKLITLSAKANSNTVTFKIGLMTDPTDASTFTEMATQALTTSYQEFEYIVPANATAHYIAIMMEAASSSSSTRYICIDDIAITEAPTCFKPTGLTYSNVYGHGATLSWLLNDETQTAWDVQVSDTVSFSRIVALVENVNNHENYVLSGLDPETHYYVRVRANCGGGDVSEWSNTVNFTTTVACPAPTGFAASEISGYTATLNWTGYSENYTVSYRTAASAIGFYEAFNASGIPTGWTQYSGLVDEVLAGTAELASGSNWTTTTYGLGAYNAKLNIYGTSRKNWLVTPEVTLENGYNLDFDLALTDYGNSDPIEDPTAQADDRFVVLVYADEAWTILREWNNTGSENVYNTIATAGEHVSIDLSAYVGKTVKIAFYGESTVTDNGDNDLHIDNVIVGIPVATGEWQTVTVDEAPVTLTDLTPETTYEAKVQGNCGDDGLSLETNVITFTTLDACPTPTGLAVVDSLLTATSAGLSWNGSIDVDSYTVQYRTAAHDEAPFMQNFESETSLNGWTFIGDDVNGIDATGTYHAGLHTTAAHSGSNGFRFSSYSSSDDYNQYLISPELTVTGELKFYYKRYTSGTGEVFSVGYSTTTNDVEAFTWGDTINATTTWQAYTQELPTDAKYFAIHYFTEYQYYLYVDDITIGAHTVPAGEWQTASSATTNVTLTDLTPETPYEAQVKSDCSDPEEWSNMVTFTTLEQTDLSQVIELQEGTNWVSFYVNVTLDDLKAALVAALPAGNSTAITIQSQDQNVKYQRGRWVGQLAALDMAQMYKITVSSACEVSFEGTPIDPSTLSITINANGNTWIAYPYNQSMTVTALFTGFAVNNDQVSSFTQSTKFRNNRWVGQLTTLEAGQGYIYKTEATTPRTFTFPAVSRNVQSR